METFKALQRYIPSIIMLTFRVQYVELFLVLFKFLCFQARGEIACRMASSGVQRNSFYGVISGRVPGIYTSWSQCQQQTDKFSGECHAGFASLKECIAFMQADGNFSYDAIDMYGPRGKKYSLQEWNRKHPESEIDNEARLEDEPLVVSLPHEDAACPNTGARPKVDPTHDIILDPLLAYVHFSLQSGTSDSIRKAVVGFFPAEAIAEAKEVIHEKVDNDIIGVIWI